MFVSAGDDGCIKIWDAISGRVVHTIIKAHDNQPVTSVKFSGNDKFLLSSGLDSIGKLWDLSTYKIVVSYTGAIHRVYHVIT